LPAPVTIFVIQGGELRRLLLGASTGLPNTVFDVTADRLLQLFGIRGNQNEVGFDKA
jgi:hypothetical protein